jgi:hypothetical protein
MNAFWVRYRARFAWIATLALLMQALLPAVINSTQSRNIHLAEICTAFGIKKIAVPDSFSNSSLDTSSAFGQCPVCSLADLTSLPPAFAARALPPSGAAAPAVQLPDTTTIQEPVWPRAYPRGPPLPVFA